MLIAGSAEDEGGEVVPEVPDVVAAEPPEGSSPAVAAEPSGSSSLPLPGTVASQCFAGEDTVLWQGVITERRV